jgi:hypothetical protein
VASQQPKELFKECKVVILTIEYGLLSVPAISLIALTPRFVDLRLQSVDS